MRLTGKTAVITGGASGIGAETASLFKREGAKVAILDPQQANGDHLSLIADVTDESSVSEAMAAIVQSVGPIDILINNAGVPGRETIEQLPEATWDRVVDVSLKGAFLCSKQVLPHMRTEGGSIVHISSVAGIVGMRNRPAYSAAKAGLVALARNMALDFAHRNIRVNCVCPGFVRTPLVAGMAADPERWNRMVALHPLGRIGEPCDIAKALLFLASDDAAWITGTCLVVDGGFSAGHYADV
ncbi:MAG TPA: SDR family NAD(P)-dependent oxidoreductase [Bryobacteraceae bacterium]|nr:SDR family NAD(P)-dependent oxidoreductase [Bryobacteraceae bacterium]